MEKHYLNLVLLIKTIHKLENNEFKIKFEIDGIDHITNKISIVLLICALLISSSFVSFGPFVFDMPVISLIGYLMALVLSIFGVIKFVVKV